MAATPAENTLITSKFSYRPLDKSDGIRLIYLLPALDAEAEVRCELIHTTLSNCTDIYEHYTALSYVWGDPIYAKTIWLDETAILVTHNLFSALRDLRSDSRPLRIWADAICINQQDDDEKLRQISMMGKIYSLADHTVIYLNFLNPQEAAKLDGCMSSNLDDWLSSNVDKSQFSADIAELILSHTWFRRVWVFQELVLSKDPRVQIGRHRFPWIALYRIVQSHRQPFTTGLRPLAASEGSRLHSEMHKAHQEHQKQERMRMKPGYLIPPQLLVHIQRVRE
ncbi:HET-domain-containing protein [Hyaloscypha variabilis F]|uniref:HET-domain-containing protein n=1 Tax=Hyaloscypha variabilis (strain UAMH 11265 / GT02V1 / F) TaxID=1149755 RepID=A0A2J6RCI3_HYAVF|nr:HET-domain-containing protein [Hyaloscypha variabilis F]